MLSTQMLMKSKDHRIYLHARHYLKLSYVVNKCRSISAWAAGLFTPIRDKNALVVSGTE
jgi:hypothetical protein